jgi:cell division initiation protein
MTITPQDIQSQQFHVRFRGFDVEEVDAFLERIAEEFLVLIEENKQLASQVEAMKQETDSYRHREKAFQTAIISAQQIAEEMKAKSQRKAEEITAAAKEEARQLQKKAKAEITGLEAEVNRLNQMKQQASQELRHILQGYLDRLEVGENAQDFAAGEEKPPLSPTSKAATGGLASKEVEKKLVDEEADEESVNGKAEGESVNEEDGESVVDLSDLYEKIELTEDELAAVSEVREEAESDEDTRDLFAMEITEEIEEPEETEESTLPDLDGDMLFTLEDPLDEEEPEISFEEETEEEQDRRNIE